MTRIVFRDALGRFSTRTKSISFQFVDEMGEFKELRKTEKFFKYTYLISFDYNKKGRKGSHPFHAEYKLESPKQLSPIEISEIIINSDQEFSQVLDASRFSIKGEEVEDVDTETKLKVLQIKFDHKG